MKTKERQEQLISLIPYNGYLMVKDLSERFDVTEETIRRDLQKICDDDPSIKKVHGGVYRITEKESAAPEELRRVLLTEEKTLFASLSITLLHPGDTVILDSSTTSLFIAEEIRRKELPLHIITNSIQLSELFYNDEKTDVTLLGGKLRKTNRSLVGDNTIKMLNKYYANFAFLSPTSISREFGLSDNNEEERDVRLGMIEHAEKTILVVDHTKFGWTSPNLIAPLPAVDMVITDSQTDKEWQTIFNNLNIEYRIC